MKPRIVGFSPSARQRAAAVAALAAGACLVIAGCAGSSSPSGMASEARGAPAAGGAIGAPAVAAGGLVPAQRAAAAPGASGTRLPGLATSGQAIVYTASLTLRSRDVSHAAALASQLATAAGGYVASENTSITPGHPGRSTVSIQLRVPVSAYQATLAALTSGRFGTQLSLSRQAQDVTQTVADVTSRAASARAAIAQLRALLARAGSVPALLDVQNQINDEESSLESLLAQQRSLDSQTSYATVSVLLQGKTAAARHQRRPARGFLAGLAAGWRAFVRVTVAVLTGLGAALPFLIAAGLLGFGGYRAWRWRLGRRARPPAAA